MTMKHTPLTWTLRLIVFGLFILSAVAKMFPIWSFDKQLVDLGLTTWCQAPYFTRALIGLELAIGIAIMQANYLRRIVIPVTIALLVVFCIHLTIEMVKHGAMNGNCGCFGQLIPMTPLEATIKNLVTIALLVILYKKSSDKPSGENKFSVLLIIWLASTLFMYVAFPFCPCPKANAATTELVTEAVEDSAMVDAWAEDTVVVDSNAVQAVLVDSSSKTTVKKDSLAAPVQEVPKGPAKVKSRFSDVNVFSGKKVNLDEGKRILCFFAAGCDHCQHTARDLNKMAKANKGFPPVTIYFMDEETHLIPDFFKIAGREYPYKILDIPTFWTMIGNDGSTPGVFYLWNGNIIKYWVGIDDKKFVEQELLNELKK